MLGGQSRERRFESDVLLNAQGARRARLNGDALRSAEQLRHELQTLVFTPDRLAVVKGGPAARRAYVDRTLGRLFPAKTTLSVEYAAAVGQRNAALRRLAAGLSSRPALDPWNEAVASLGAELVEARKATLQVLEGPFATVAERLGLASATASYEGDPPTVAELEGRLGKDVERGATGAGPHLHDVGLRSGARDLRSFGSQGEQRIAVLALVLAEAEALSRHSAARPLVLLDDVLSELDDDRRRTLAEIVAEGGQTMVTTTSARALPAEPAQHLAVSTGEVRAA